MNIGNESETIEFKRSTSETKEGIVSIASILNKHPEGILYFGVKDNGDVIGQQIGKDTARKLSRAIADAIRPMPFYEVDVRNSGDGLKFIEVRFSGDEAPYSAAGRYYQRFADEDRQIADVELAKLFARRRKDYSEWENSDSGITADAIDQKLLQRIVERGNESGRIRYEFADVRAVASKLGLVHPATGNLNNAGNVLLSQGAPVLLKTAVFATATRDTFIKLNHFEGNIFECIDEAISFVLDAIGWSISFTSDAERIEIPEIPRRAIREIVVNAFAHGSYSAQTAFSVEVFGDRVEIYSPGCFPAGFTPEDFAERAAEPIMLNPKIVGVLFKSGEIESFGSGFERAFRDCREVGVGYSYESTKTGFRFTLHRTLGQQNVQDVSKTCPRRVQELTDTERAVYEAIKECDYLPARKIAERIGKSEKTVYRALKRLKEGGIIVRIGGDSNGYWDILK